MKKYIFLSILYIVCIFFLFGCGKDNITVTVQKKEGEDMVSNTFTDPKEVTTFYETLQNIKWGVAKLDVATPPTHIMYFDTHDSRNLRSDIGDTKIQVWWNEKKGYVMLYVDSSSKIGHLTEKEMKQFSSFFFTSK